MPEEWGKSANAGPSKASRASVRCEVREEVYQAPSHPLQALLGASQTTFCASPRQTASTVPRWLTISTDNTFQRTSPPSAQTPPTAEGKARKKE
jgi:hypothetical protein